MRRSNESRMFLETLSQNPGVVRGAILVSVRVGSRRNGETRYCGRHGNFYYTDSGMSGLISISGIEYDICSDPDGYFTLRFETPPIYWDSLHIKDPETKLKFDEWALSRKSLLLMAGR